MDEILIKAGGFLFMIALGFVLKRIGLFSLDDSGFLSKLVLKVTLPMAIIKNFQGLELNRSYLMAIGIGFAGNFIAIAVVMLWHWSACLMSATQLCALGLPSRLRW